MTKDELRIVYMGTPEFAALCLEEILESITNGLRKQALKQMVEAGIDFEDMIEAVANDDYLGIKEVVTMTKIAVSIGYISFNNENLRGI